MNILLLVLAVQAAQGGPRPTECFDDCFDGDLADAKVGRWMTYVTHVGSTPSTKTIKIVGKVEDDWLVDWWMELANKESFGFLYRVAPDKKVKKAWVALKGDTEWTSLVVKEAPQRPARPKQDIKQTEETKEIKAGKLQCVRIDATVDNRGRVYTWTYWYSKRVWKLHSPSEHGGLVAMENYAAKVVLDGIGEDAKPSLPLPK